MSAIAIDYDALSRVVRYSENIAQKAEDYADDLSRKVYDKFSGVAGGSSGLMSSAQYYVNAKVSALREKQRCFSGFSKQVDKLASTARRVDGEVKTMIANSQEKFLKGHENLRIEGWKAKLLNWLVDVKNSCPLFELIGDAVQAISTEMSSLFENIKHWYECEGGKEIVSLVLAIGGAALAVLVFIATLPASGFIAVCTAIAAGIALVNSAANIYTSFKSVSAARDGDPAWAKIYGKQDKLTDIMRDTNFHNGAWNRASYLGATVLDTAELFCDVVAVGGLLKNLKTKFSFVNNYFDKNMGLLDYMKTAKWDSAGKIIAKDGVVQTHFTPQSIWRGLKAFVLDSPISSNDTQGIRTILNKNFIMDFKDFKNSFSLTGLKDTFQYYKQNKSALWTAFTSNDPAKVMQAKSILKFKDYIQPFKSFQNLADKAYKLTVGQTTIQKEVFQKITNISDFGKLNDKIQNVEKKAVKLWDTTKGTLLYN